MRTILSVLILSGLVLLATGCTQNQPPGTDPVVVSAEMGMQSSLSLVEAVWNIDNDNRSYMQINLPSVHKIIEDSRREFPVKYAAAEQALAVYKLAKTQQNTTNVTDALSAVQTWAAAARQALQSMSDQGLLPKKASSNEYVPDHYADSVRRGTVPGSYYRNYQRGTSARATVGRSGEAVARPRYRIVRI